MKKREIVLKAIERWWLRRDWRVQWFMRLLIVSCVLSTFWLGFTSMSGEEFKFFGIKIFQYLGLIGGYFILTVYLIVASASLQLLIFHVFPICMRRIKSSVKT